MNFFSDVGFVVSIKKHGEKYRIVEIFTKDHGRFVALASDSKNEFSLSSFVEVDWKSKSRDLIGFWKLKSEKQNWVYALNSQNKIAIIQSICALLHGALPERVSYQELFEIFDMMFQNLRGFSDKELVAAFAYFEFVLLKAVGFGFDFKTCGICQAAEELSYVIKDSGILASKHCVSFDTGKHFEIPKVWHLWNNKIFEGSQDIQNSLEITLYFIRKNVFYFDNFFRNVLATLRLA